MAGAIPQNALTRREKVELSEWQNGIYYWGQRAFGGARLFADLGDMDPSKFPSVVVGSQIYYRYEVQGLIGTGTHGMILSAIDRKMSRNVVLKIIRKSDHPQFFGPAMPEMRFNKQLMEISKKANVVHAIHGFTCRGRNILVFKRYLKDVYADCNAVLTSGHVFLLDYIQRIIGDVATALYHLHQNKIVHCDVKAENIFVNENGRFYLGNFGMATTAGSKFDHARGTIAYLPPEIFVGLKTYEGSQDIWALGHLLFAMVSKRWLVADTLPDLVKEFHCLLGINFGRAFECDVSAPWLQSGLEVIVFIDTTHVDCGSI